MKKLLLISFIAFIFLEISSLTSYYIPNTTWTKALIPLIIGFCIMIVSGVFSLIGAKAKNKFLSFFPLVTNAIALGLCIDAWYVYRNFDNSLAIMTLVSLAAVLILWVFYIFLFIPFFNKHYGIYLVIFILLSVVAYILVVIFTETTFVSTLGYYLIISTGFLLAISTNTENELVIIKRMANSTYTVVIVGIIIAAIMLEGDLEFDLPGTELDLSSPKKGKTSDESMRIV